MKNARSGKFEGYPEIQNKHDIKNKLKTGRFENFGGTEEVRKFKQKEKMICKKTEHLRNSAIPKNSAKPWYLEKVGHPTFSGVPRRPRIRKEKSHPEKPGHLRNLGVPGNSEKRCYLEKGDIRTFRGCRGGPEIQTNS